MKTLPVIAAEGFFVVVVGVMVVVMVVVVVVAVVVVVVSELPNTFTSCRLSGRSPLSIWTMTYLPSTRLPDYCKEILIFLIKVRT